MRLFSLQELEERWGLSQTANAIKNALKTWESASGAPHQPRRGIGRYIASLMAMNSFH